MGEARLASTHTDVYECDHDARLSAGGFGQILPYLRSSEPVFTQGLAEKSLI
jgi:hypothetical protein